MIFQINKKKKEAELLEKAMRENEAQEKTEQLYDVMDEIIKLSIAKEEYLAPVIQLRKK